MSVFLYYFPGYGATRSQLMREDVSRTFAAESLWDVMHTPGRWSQNTVLNLLSRGPDTAPGMLLTCQPGNQEIPGFLPGYYPDQQTWVKLPGSKEKGTEDAWLGWYNDPKLLPNPEYLRRLWPVPGKFVEMADGRQWEAPIIRAVPRRQVTLPKTLALQDDDSVSWEVKPEFAEFLTLSDDIWNSYWGIDGRVMDTAEVLKSVVKCLNLNYRVSRPEVRALKLLDSDNWQEVFRAANNFDVLEELIKEDEKKESAPQDSVPSAGGTDSTKPAEVSGNSTSPPSAG